MAAEGVNSVQRTVGIAVDFSPCSKAALHWAAESMLRSGDRLVLVHVLKQVLYEEGEMQLWEATGTPLIPLLELSDPVIEKKYGVKVDAAFLDICSSLAKQKEVVVVMKVYYGDAREKLCGAVDDIPLDCLIIGSRGLSTIKRAIMGNVSNYVVNNASCPVTVVKSPKQEG